MSAALFRAWQNPGPDVAQSLTETLLYYLLFTAVDFRTAVLAFRMEPAEDKRLLAWLIPQRFVYRQLMYFVAIKSVLAVLRGFEVGWGKLERKATVSPMPEMSAIEPAPRRRSTDREAGAARTPAPRTDLAERPLDPIVHARAPR